MNFVVLHLFARLVLSCNLVWLLLRGLGVLGGWWTTLPALPGRAWADT